MAWTIEYLASVRKDMRKLDRTIQSRITKFMDERVALLEEPRTLGKALKGGPDRIWRYRVGDYRILCDIQDSRLVVLVIELGHHGDIYR